MAEFFLCAAANRNDHVCRATTTNQRNKTWIADFHSITRRDVTILAGNRYRFPPRPIQQLSRGALVRNDPKYFSALRAFERCEKMLQVFEPRNPLEAPTTEQTIQQNHQTTVGNRQISRDNRT